jgi:hypothetical protein
VIYNLDHDIRHSNYFFDKNLQLDVVVVVVELGHKNMLVVGGQEEFVEHIVVVVQGHMFVGVVELVVVVEELEHMFVVVHNGVVVLEGVGDMIVKGEIVEYIVVVEHMLDHMKEVVVVEVVLVEFLRMQQLNFCDHMLGFQNHRRDLVGIEVEWW